jgi:hypothetical protein
MKKILFLVCIAVFAIGKMSAQTDTTKLKPVIKFESTTYDFGTITKGSDGTFKMEYTNDGNGAIVVTGVQKTCGCTSTDWSKEPVKKGQKGWIKITYNTNIVGSFQKTVFVNSNATTPTLAISFKGTVVDGSAVQTPASTIEKTK